MTTARRGKVGTARKQIPATFQRLTQGFETLECRHLLATFFVSNLDDSGEGSLRQAVLDANALPGADEIVFEEGALEGTIFLKTGQLEITDAVAINGPGADQLTIDAGQDSRLFLIDDGNGAQLIDVAISGLKLTGGAVDGFGGAISNRESLHIDHSVISGNSASDGGGGIYTFGRSLLSVMATTIHENVTGAAGDGGGIFSSFHSNVYVTSSTISGNSAETGGGIFSGGFNDMGRLNISNSTLSGNTATVDGGGIFTYFGRVTIVSTTVAENIADADDDGNGGGGGIHSESMTPTLNPTLHNTIVAMNIWGAAESPDDLWGAFAGSSSHNLIGVDSNLVGIVNGVNGNQVGSDASPLDPQLGPLQDNGGPTWTHALLPGSPAVDAGRNDQAVEFGQTGHASGIVPLQTDQRLGSFSRFVDGNGDAEAIVDIGAFEMPALTNFNGDGRTDAADLDLLVASIALASPTSARFDLTHDGRVDLRDRDEWLALAGATNLPSQNPFLLGDANLDGTVDELDFLAWNMNRFQTVAAWTAGDFNADGAVDGQDFRIWYANKFKSADDQPPTDPDPAPRSNTVFPKLHEPVDRRPSQGQRGATVVPASDQPDAPRGVAVAAQHPARWLATDSRQTLARREDPKPGRDADSMVDSVFAGDL